MSNNSEKSIEKSIQDKLQENEDFFERVANKMNELGLMGIEYSKEDNKIILYEDSDLEEPEEEPEEEESETSQKTE